MKATRSPPVGSTGSTSHIDGGDDSGVVEEDQGQDVDGGDIDFEGMAHDADLESLHGPEFDALLAQVHRNAAAARAPATGDKKN